MPAPAPTMYGRFARLVMRRAGLAIGVLAAVSIVALALATRIRVDSDILHLLPQDDPTTQALERIDKEEGGVNVLTIAVESEHVAKRDAFLDDLDARLRALPEVDYVLWKLDPSTTYRLGLLQLPVADLELLRDRVKAALTLGPALSNPFMAARVLDLGPLADRLGTAGNAVQLAGPEGVGRLIVRPKGSAHDIPFARAFMADVRRVLAEADAPGHGVTVKWIGGAYRHNVEDYEGIVADIGWTTGASFVLVLVIIAAAFRAPRALVAIFAPLLVGNLWTVAVAAATVGSLNTFTSFTNAVLIGLGVEFGVHLYARFREYLHEGLSIEDAVAASWDAVGGACTSACLTAAAGFAALMAAQFGGFRQLGWLLSLGLLLTLIAELAMMPVILAWTERKHVGRPAPTHRGRRGRRFPALYRVAPVALMVVGSTTLIAALMVPRVQFEFDLSELRRQGLAYADLDASERELVRDSYAPLIAAYETDEAMTAAYNRLQKRIPAFGEGDGLHGAQVFSLRTILPQDQGERVSILREIQALGRDPSAAYLPAGVRQALDRLAGEDIHELTAEDLPRSVQHVLGAGGDKHRLLVVPAGNMWDMREAERLCQAVEREFPGEVIAGEYLTLGTLYRTMQRDAPVICAIAFSLVAFFTWLDLRRVRPTLGALGVMMAGVAWWGALLAMSGIKLSMVNFVGIPIVLGIGIDVMIHLFHRLRQEGPGRIQHALATTGWASALGTSTTVVAFAALSLGTSQGIRGLGLLVLLGEAAVTVAGFVLVPLGFAAAWNWAGRHPPRGEP